MAPVWDSTLILSVAEWLGLRSAFFAWTALKIRLWHTQHAYTGMYFRLKICIYQLRCICKGKGHPVTYLCWHGEEADLQLKLGAGWRWVVSTTARPLYLREGFGTHCIGAGWA
jgi:hypothetical protein